MGSGPMPSGRGQFGSNKDRSPRAHGVFAMRLGASTPDSKPLPEPIRGILSAVSQDDLREVVEKLSVPRPTGSPENEAVRRVIIELFTGMQSGRPSVEV